MSMAQERYEELVRRLEPTVVRNPARYRVSVVLLALLGFLYLLFILLILLASIAGVIFAMANSHHFGSAGVKIILLLLVPAWFILRALWVRFPPPRGIPLTRAQAPGLFALIDELPARCVRRASTAC